RDQVATLDPEDRGAGQALLRALGKARLRTREELMAALDSPRYFTLLDRIEATIAAPPVADPAVALLDIAAGAFKKLRKTVKGLPKEPTDADFHAIRIKAKRARYSAELVVPEVGRPVERFIDRVKDLQDLLGDNQDAVVAETRLREVAKE